MKIQKRQLGVFGDGTLMKIKLGFVTNSSSTNYVIIWKGKQDNLLDILKEHKADNNYLTPEQKISYSNSGCIYLNNNLYPISLFKGQPSLIQSFGRDIEELLNSKKEDTYRKQKAELLSLITKRVNEPSGEPLDETEIEKDLEKAMCYQTATQKMEIDLDQVNKYDMEKDLDQ